MSAVFIKHDILCARVYTTNKLGMSKHEVIPGYQGRGYYIFAIIGDGTLSHDPNKLPYISIFWDGFVPKHPVIGPSAHYSRLSVHNSV